MVEQKTLSTTTIATSNSSLGEIQIYTFYNRNFYDCLPPSGWTDNPLIKESFLSETNGYKNGVLFVEGDEVITCEEYPSSINFWIDSNGDFFIKGDDANNYSINSNGELEYDFCL